MSPLPPVSISGNMILAFPANDMSFQVLACSSQDGAHWTRSQTTGKVTSGYRLGDNGAPDYATPVSLVFFQGSYWMARFTETIKVNWSLDGVSWSDDIDTGLNAMQAYGDQASLFVFNGRLWLCYRKISNGAVVLSNSINGLKWSAETTTGQTTRDAPAVAVWGQSIVVAFISNDVDNKILLIHSVDGSSWGPPSDTGQFSKISPALWVDKSNSQSTLYLAFARTDNGAINVYETPTMWSWSLSHAFPARGPSLWAPDAQPFGREIYLATTDGSRNVKLTTSQGSLINLPESTPSVPALCAVSLSQGQVRPSFMVLAVLYCPPGNGGGLAGSTVTYSLTNIFGSKVSISKSLVNEFSFELQSAGSGGGLGFNYDKTDSSSVETSVMVTEGVTLNSEPYDGIDHRYDRFLLWLGPLIKTTLVSSAIDSVLWEPSVDGPIFDPLILSASELLDPSTMVPDHKRRLDKAGVTPDQYPEILKTNPFLLDEPFDGSRFTPLEVAFVYNPPDVKGGVASNQFQTLERSSINTTTSSVTLTYSVSMEVSQGLEGIFDEKLKDKLEWSQSSSTTKSVTDTQSASIVINGPAMGYTGPTSVIAYLDNVFGTFAFCFATSDPEGRRPQPQGPSHSGSRVAEPRGASL